MHGTNVKTKEMHHLAFSWYYFLVANTVCPLSYNLRLPSGGIFHYVSTQSKVAQAISDSLGFIFMLLCTFSATCFSLSKKKSHHQAKLDYQRKL
jgi:hypothetical protein